MNQSFHHFESLCLDLQNGRNITASSNALMEMQDLKPPQEVLYFCVAYLQQQQPQQQQPQSGIFHALSMMHNVLARHWNSPVVDLQSVSQCKNSVMLVLSKCLHDFVSTDGNGSLQGFLCAKAMQVHISLWKYSWFTVDVEERRQFLNHMYKFLNPDITATSTLREVLQSKMAGAALIHALIEDFSDKHVNHQQISNRSLIKNAEKVKENFETNDLSSVLAMSLDALKSITQDFEKATDTDSSLLYISTLTGILKILEVILTWRCNPSLANTSEDVALDLQASRSLPSTWSSLITDRSLISCNFAIVTLVIQSLVKYGNAVREVSDKCLTEAKNLLLSICSLNGDIFQQEEYKLMFGGYIMENILSLVAKEELLNKESRCDIFVSVVLRLIKNFNLTQVSKMNNFESVMINLAIMTNEVANNIKSMTDAVMLDISSSKCTNSSNISIVKDLLSSEKGELLSLCLEVWVIVFNDQNMIGSDTALTEGFRSWCSSISTHMFNCLFATLVQYYVFDAVVSMEEEEDEEAEEIDSVNAEDLFSAVCTIGRACFAHSLALINHCLNEHLEQLKALLNSNDSSSSNGNYQLMVIQSLESISASLIFTSYLCIDNFHSSNLLTSIKWAEDNTINPMILAAFKQDGSTTSNLMNLLSSTCSILQFQVGIFDTKASSPILSPYLLRTIFRFFSNFIATYLDPKLSNYSEESLENYPHLKMLHDFQDFNTILDMVLFCIHRVLVHLPFEGDLVIEASSIILSLSHSCNKNRLLYALNNQSLSLMAQLITTFTNTNNRELPADKVCRLNAESMTAMYHSFANLFIATNHEMYYKMLCEAIFSQVQHINAKNANSVTMDTVLCSLRGIARSPKGFNVILQDLFDASLSVIHANIKQYLEHDNIFTSYLLVLKEYTEYQLTSLRNSSCLELYKICYSFLKVFCDRFSQSATNISETEFEFRNTSFLYTVELINNLSYKDFDFPDFDSTMGDMCDAKSFESETATVLYYGLEVMIPLLSEQMLSFSPKIAENYYSFVSYIFSLYGNYFINWAQGHEYKEVHKYFHTLIAQLLFGFKNVDVQVGRQALQVISDFYSHFMNSLLNIFYPDLY